MACSSITKLLGLFLLLVPLVALAAPVPVSSSDGLAKRGGYYNDAGVWIDDGFWAWSHGPKTSEFVPWADSNYGTGLATDVSANAGSGEAPAHASSPLSSGYMGTGTYFFQNGNAGACGNYNSDSAYVVALQTSMYSGGSHCGRSIKIINRMTGQSLIAVVADMCPTCGSSTDVDLSVGTFHALGGTDEGGIIQIEWSFA